MKTFQPMMLAVVTFLGAVLLNAAAAADTVPNKTKAVIPYPLSTCPVSEKALKSMGTSVVKVIDGRELRFCCSNCPKKFEANPEAYLKKVDSQIIKQQQAYYPLKTCPVSGEALDSMSAPVDYVYQNQLVRFCCPGCIKKFKANPAEYIKKIDSAAATAQMKVYPLDYCLVSGDKLGGDMGDPVEFVTGNRLYRLCCKDCVKTLRKFPSKYQTILDGAWAGKTAALQEDGQHHPIP